MVISYMGMSHLVSYLVEAAFIFMLRVVDCNPVGLLSYLKPKYLWRVVDCNPVGPLKQGLSALSAFVWRVGGCKAVARLLWR